MVGFTKGAAVRMGGNLTGGIGQRVATGIGYAII